MYFLGTKITFRAEHSLDFEPGAESTRHGHEYSAEMVFSGRRLSGVGMLVDVRSLRKISKNAISPFEGRNLNDLPEFQRKTPTMENLCTMIWDKAAPMAKKEGVELVEIRLSEDDFTWASFRRDRPEDVHDNTG